MTFVSLNPTSNTKIQSFPSWDDSRLERALEHTRNAQQLWAHSSFVRRAEIMRNVAYQLRTRRDSYAALITQEIGKPLLEARAEVEK
jgi:succinate-semialdehyde dehydrogenase / glutarate-semialdehyde dehydrogenase